MEYIIRPVQAGDGEGLNALRRMPGVFENMLGIPSERIKRNEDYIQSMDANTHAFVAVCKEIQNRDGIIGWASLNVHANLRKRHMGAIALMVHKDYQGMKVGTKLMEAMLDVADNWLMLKRLELSVFVDNERAITLYQKFGFVIEGTLVQASIRNGQYVDEFTMARLR